MTDADRRPPDSGNGPKQVSIAELRSRFQPTAMAAAGNPSSRHSPCRVIPTPTYADESHTPTNPAPRWIAPQQRVGLGTTAPPKIVSLLTKPGGDASSRQYKPTLPVRNANVNAKDSSSPPASGPPRGCHPVTAVSGTVVDDDDDDGIKRRDQPLPLRSNVEKSSGECPPSQQSTCSIRPNRSHLSSLISEIQHQQLVQQLQRPTIATAISTKDDFAVVRAAAAPPPPPFRDRALAVMPDFLSPPAVAHPPASEWKRRPLPSVSELGPAPSRPSRPAHLTVPLLLKAGPTPPLPQRNRTRNDDISVVPKLKGSEPLPALPSNVTLLKLRGNCRATSRLPSLPSVPASDERRLSGSSSPIPEYTVEQELGDCDSSDELYDDGGAYGSSTATSRHSNSSTNLPYSEEIYQDSSNKPAFVDDVYEDIGVNDDRSSDRGSTYGKWGKSEERSGRKEDKKARKLIKEAEKNRKRFNLVGNEEARYSGVTKEAVKPTLAGRRDELPVKSGEFIDILRIEGNPIGKWLARNEDGRVGYVSLTNIQIDANFIRRVMTPTKLPIGPRLSEDESSDLYDDGNSEAIYEEFK